MAYSVLMSVYAKENAAYFSDAVESMLHQSALRISLFWCATGR